MPSSLDTSVPGGLCESWGEGESLKNHSFNKQRKKKSKSFPGRGEGYTYSCRGACAGGSLSSSHPLHPLPLPWVPARGHNGGGACSSHRGCLHTPVPLPWGHPCRLPLRSLLHSKVGKQGVPQGGRLLNWLFRFPQEPQCHPSWDGSLEPSRIRSRSAVMSRSLNRRSEALSPRGEAGSRPGSLGAQVPWHGTQCWPA